MKDLYPCRLLKLITKFKMIIQHFSQHKKSLQYCIKFSQIFIFHTLCIDCRQHFMLLITKNQLNSQIEGYRYFPSSSPIRNVIIQKDI